MELLAISQCVNTLRRNESVETRGKEVIIEVATETPPTYNAQKYLPHNDNDVVISLMSYHYVGGNSGRYMWEALLPHLL